VDTGNVGVIDVVTPADLTPQRRQQLLSELTRELAAVPGIQSAAAAHKIPLRGPGSSTGFEIEGGPDVGRVTTLFRFVTPGYFDTLGIAVRRGRAFTEADRAAERWQSGEAPIVINEALATKYFAGVDPVGRRVATGFGGWARIVGVVENVAEAGLTDEVQPARYLPHDILPFTPEVQVLVFRAEAGRQPAALLAAARRTVQRVAPGVAVQDGTTMERVFARAVGPVRQLMTLVSLLTALALVLGGIGIYGVIAHFVARHARDWGVRLALGLTPAKVVAGIVRRGVGLVVVGVLLGILGFLALASLLSSFLYGVGRTDPLALCAATGALLLIGALAALVPALRASRTDPATVLRED
jgi:hypothetical protein